MADTTDITEAKALLVNLLILPLKEDATALKLPIIVLLIRVPLKAELTTAIAISVRLTIEPENEVPIEEISCSIFFTNDPFIADATATNPRKVFLTNAPFIAAEVAEKFTVKITIADMIPLKAELTAAATIFVFLTIEPLKAALFADRISLDTFTIEPLNAVLPAKRTSLDNFDIVPFIAAAIEANATSVFLNIEPLYAVDSAVKIAFVNLDIIPFKAEDTAVSAISICFIMLPFKEAETAVRFEIHNCAPRCDKFGVGKTRGGAWYPKNPGIRTFSSKTSLKSIQ